ncbi:UvrD-helicase domain-containing protein [Ktedonobacter sp. SOSP1-52]|uniref:UvrD-helicase domain-containing protein n=1 Tax=Ktedonobacter sp. SOSP1-52 TaxID=2778366 RepID=UPI0019156F7E|nr:UvrD-helicase domain-containing protein [Ktedonobacter sp. SOSP1-52]
MATQRQFLLKPALLNDILALPHKEMHQVMEKISALVANPEPEGKVKMRFKKYWKLGIKLYRLRSGRFRIFYTYNEHSVSICTIRMRDANTYEDEVELDDEELTPEELADLGVDPQALANAQRERYQWQEAHDPEDPPFPEPVTVELLQRLRIPPAFHARLLRLKSRQQLWECPGLDEDTILRLDQFMFEAPLLDVISQPDLVGHKVDDLLRYKEGELLDFLLKLSPEQEPYARWSLNAAGPALVKGGPGTGKSTIALYRVQSLLQQLLRQKGQAAPRILFTTYTNALINSSSELLRQLLGEDARFVTVQTADKLISQVLHECQQQRPVLSNDELNKLTRRAVEEATFEGNLLQQQAQKQTLTRMGLSYLLEELTTIIVARQLTTLEAYLAAPRTGRKLRLNATQRKAVWRVYQRWCALIEKSGKETWQQRHARAEQLVEQSRLHERFDAVVIDEAQDLDPCALRLLVKLSKAANRIFITADANQSIYGSGFTWSDVHQDLRFQGRTSILHANYRSTQEIGEAANAYLTFGALEPVEAERRYVNNGPMPDVRAVLNGHHEVQLLASFFRKASLNLRLTLGACAVLVPSEKAGRAIADGLNAQNLEACYMSGQELNLARPGIKVLTLKSAKGLEFPIVALSGFLGSVYPAIPENASTDERAEILGKERRTIYVGMTRAMRALLVITPVERDNELLIGFEPTYWNLSS